MRARAPRLAKTISSTIVNRRCAVDTEMTSVIGMMSETGTSGSISCTAFTTEGSDAHVSVARLHDHTHEWVGEAGRRQIAGPRAARSRGSRIARRRRRRRSHPAPCRSKTIRSVWPIGSDSPKYFFTIVSLTMTRRVFGAVSRRSNNRPRRSGMPIALK